jgi:multidrug efflux pump subunit AcrA (membrane-fusion protein)
MRPKTESQTMQRPARRSESRGDRPDAAAGRWWKRSLLAIVIAVVVASAAMFVPVATSSRQTGSRLTHTITRGDLVVTVTEQGTLESSNNTEVKCGVRGYSTVIWVIAGGSLVQVGDELFRLDTKIIEETVSLQKTNAHLARATLERSIADVKKAKIAISAYIDGTFRLRLKSLERDLTIAESNLNTAQEALDQSKLLFLRGYLTKLEVEANGFTVAQARLEFDVNITKIDILKRITKKMQMEALDGNLIASQSKLSADKAGLAMDEIRRDRALAELELCVVKAERSGLVIYPSAAAWKKSPDVAEGALVRKDQVLLLMPDLSNMQVKVGIHESIIDRVQPGLPTTITMPDMTLDAEISSVASVTSPAGWWTGNVVKYETVIKLPAVEGLKPGMTAEVEVTIAVHKDVLTIPVAAVVETEEGDFCWITTDNGVQRCTLQLGDTNDVFIVVEAGLKEGDKVVLNPLAFVQEAQTEVLKPLDEETQLKESGKSAIKSKQPETLEADDGD